MESFGLDFHKICHDEETLSKWQRVQLRLQIEQEEVQSVPVGFFIMKRIFISLQALKFAASEYKFKNPIVLVDKGLPSRAAYAHKVKAHAFFSWA